MWSLDTTQSVALITALSAAAGSLMTVIAVKVWPMIQAWRNQDHEQKTQDRKYADDREEKGYLFVISEITKSRDDFAAEVKRLSQQLLEAVQEREFLKGQDREKTLRITMLEKELAEQHEEIKALRAWKHDISNSVSTIQLKQAVAEKEKENGK